MQPDRFTIKSQEAIAAAGQLAEQRNHPQVTPEHLLAVLLESEGGVVVPVLEKVGATPATVRSDVGAAMDALPTLSADRPIPWASRTSSSAPCAPPRTRRARCRTSTCPPSTCCSL